MFKTVYRPPVLLRPVNRIKHLRLLRQLSPALMRDLRSRDFLTTKKEFKQCRSYVSPVVQSQLTLHSLEICADPPSRALIVGVYADEDNPMDEGILTPVGWSYNIKKCKMRLIETLRLSGPMPKRGEIRMFFHIEPTKSPQYSVLTVIGLGKECLGFNPYEVIDEQKEAIRRGVGKACMELALLDTSRIDVDNCGHAESAAEGAALGIYVYQDLKSKKNHIKIPAIDLYTTPDDECDIQGWRIGIHKANAQNLTRQLQEMPGNILTPTGFAKQIVDLLCKSGVNVEVKVEGWCESQMMNAFLATAKASCEPAIFIELSYFGTSPREAPIVLVGQGITYDTGGLCLKPTKDLYHMRADMTGAAVVVSTMRAVAQMRLPVNIRGLIPLCEALIGCNAMRPGDIVKAMNNKHYEIQGTDHDDILVLVDALLYAQNFCPNFILDIATTSRSMRPTLDESASGVFTNSEILWQQIKNASMHTGDRVWRMPLWDYYSHLIANNGRCDVQNYGIGRGARPCKAAAVLRSAVPCGQWIHIDATSVMRTNGKHYEYLREGMAGRPTRTVVEFIAQYMCKDTAPLMRKPKTDKMKKK